MSVSVKEDNNFTCKVVVEHKLPVRLPLCEGIPVLQPSRLYPCSSGRDNSSCARTGSLEILSGTVLIKFIVYFNEEISDFLLCCGRFSPTEI